MADYPQITGYPNLYYHTYTDRKIPEETRRLGWITTKTTKEAMLSRLAQTVESRGLTIFCKNNLLEMQGFVWDAEKKRFCQNYRAPGSPLSHDDEIMALAIANECERTPGKIDSYRQAFERVGSFEDCSLCGSKASCLHARAM